MGKRVPDPAKGGGQRKQGVLLTRRWGKQGKS